MIIILTVVILYHCRNYTICITIIIQQVSMKSKGTMKSCQSNGEEVRWGAYVEMDRKVVLSAPKWLKTKKKQAKTCHSPSCSCWANKKDQLGHNCKSYPAYNHIAWIPIISSACPWKRRAETMTFSHTANPAAPIYTSTLTNKSVKATQRAWEWCEPMCRAARCLLPWPTRKADATWVLRSQQSPATKTTSARWSSPCFHKTKTSRTITTSSRHR